MARDQNTFEKHRRELEKKRKAEAKRERRRRRKEVAEESNRAATESSGQSGGDPEVAGNPAEGIAAEDEST